MQRLRIVELLFQPRHVLFGFALLFAELLELCLGLIGALVGGRGARLEPRQPLFAFVELRLQRLDPLRQLPPLCISRLPFGAAIALGGLKLQHALFAA